MNFLKMLYPFAVFGFELLKSELKKSRAADRPSAPMTPEEVNLMRWPTDKNG
jgi:hypothetical protein